MRARLAAGLLGFVMVCTACASYGQQVTVRTPFHTAQDSYFEQSQINWSGNYRGVTFSFGGGALAVPQFGSPDKTAGLTTNFAILNKDLQLNFSFNYGAGYRQSLVTQTPSVTIMNGQQGYFSDTSQTPFVISVVPVVGAFPAAPPAAVDAAVNPGVDPRVQAMLVARADAQMHADAQAAAQAQAGGVIQPLPQNQRQNNLAPRQNKAVDVPPPLPDPGDAAAERLNEAEKSTAGRPAPSVAEAKRLRQQEQAAADEELAALMVRAQALEEDGKPSVAKIYYQRVAKHATGELQQQARQKLYELGAKP